MKLNENYLKLQESYLFSTVAKKVDAFRAANPDKEIFRLGIGDVTKPLAPSVVAALERAAAEMADAATFRGYGPEQGYGFLREAIKNYYALRGVSLDENEIFVSDGAKSDLGNFTDVLLADGTALLQNPVYPAYYDVNVMLGKKVLFAVGDKENGFLPMPDESVRADVIYLCSPNNPTGAVYDKKQLKKWVDYAAATDALILFDAAYEAYVRSPELPRSIYEIEGAKNCCVEICSLSKTAGFTGLRAGYTVVPKEIADGRLNAFWNRRQTTKFNGVAYVVQRAAEAVFSPQGQKEVRGEVDYYMSNARTIHDALCTADIKHTGGVNSPYIWLECPSGVSSWEYFDTLLSKVQVVGTPGVGFGDKGEGYFRLTAFGDRDKTAEAIKRLCSIR